MLEGIEKVALGLGALIFAAWILDDIIGFLSRPAGGFPLIAKIVGGIAALIGIAARIYYRHSRSRV